jgi:protein-tyrosine phosphatase
MFHKTLQVLKKPILLKSYNKVFGVSNADRIHDYLYLGNVEASKDLHFLKENQIDAIINCTENESFHPYFDDKPKFRIPVQDSRNETNQEAFYQYLKESTKFIDEHVDQQKIVFVHCYWGIMRSATVVAVHLMKRYGFTPQVAIDYVKAKRPKALNSMYNFNELIERYYQEEIFNK